MKTTPLLTVALLSLFLWCTTPVAPAQDENRFEEIQELAQRNLADALVEAKEFLAELRIQHERNAGHMVIGKAASLAGTIASRAGDHEEAVSLLTEGTGIIAKAREGAPLLDEFVYRGTLYDSLLELGRTADALAMTEKTLERVRKEVARFPRALTLKVDTGPGQESDLNDLLPSKAWIVKLLENIGTLQLEAENWAEAEKALREAEEILGEIHPEQEALVAKLREGWETAARAQGKPIRPRVVGRFGHPRAIRIEGAAAVTADEISSALVRSGSFVMASHPSADFEKFLEKTKRCLELGYRSAGFPEVRVVVEWDEGNDTVVVRMVEGPRFKKGAIRIHGAVVVTEKELLERLIKQEGDAPKTLSRAEASYRGILESKRLGRARMKDPFEEFLPEGGPEKKEGEEGPRVDFSQLQTSSDTSAKGVWEEGRWVNFQPSFLESVEAVLRAAYAAKGHFFPEFEVKLEEGRENGVMDLAVKVVEEGSPALLGKVRVGGARIHTEQEVLEYLNLETGMELTGDYLGRINRKLYESGRFLGWEVMARRPDAEEREVDLLVEVAEEWEAPPLSEPLTRGQEAMLRFAKWLNTEAGETSDLVFSLTDENEFGPMSLTLTIGRAALALAADGLGHRLRAVAEWDGNADLVIGGEEGPGFRAAFPMGEWALTVNAWILREVPLDPYSFKTGSINFGAGISSISERKLEIGMDPAAALKWCPRAFAFQFVDGDVVIENEHGVLRFEEESGRLISLQAGSRGMQLTAKAEVGAVSRIEAEVTEMGQGIPNWLRGRAPASLFFLAIGYGVELVQDEAFWDSEGAPKELLARAAKRTGNWEPVATFLGEVLGALGGIGKEKKPEDRFMIPLDPEEMEERLKAGGNMHMLLGLGLYETIAEVVEPGSWPDRVAREAMFIMDGKPIYLNQTVQELLQDESMGPVGCLICARLAQRVQRPVDALRFARKARGELNQDGFAKDWRLVLSGNGEDAGFGWNILKALQRLKDDEIDTFLPADPPELRGTVKELLAEARKIDSQADADALQPVMESLWENVLKPAVEEMVDKTEEALAPKWDPKVVAAGVNGMPLYRGAIRLMEMANKETPNPLGLNPFEHAVLMLLAAQEMWATGQGATPEAVKAQVELMTEALGGWEEVEKIGLNKQQFESWMGMQLAGKAQLGSWVRNGKIAEKEVREFYERRKSFFGAVGEERRLYSIRLDPDGDGQAQRKLAEEIRSRIQAAGDLDAMRAAFEVEAKQHSDELSSNEKGGDRGWVKTEELVPVFANAIAKVKDESLSEVMEITIRGTNYLYLFLIPEQGRPAEPKPFEMVETDARNYAIIEREAGRLRKVAVVDLVEEDEVPTEPKEEGEKNGLAELMAKIATGGVMEGDRSGDKKEEANEPPKGNKKKEKLTPELARMKAGEGSAEHRYYLGAYAERELLPENNGMKAAVGHYELAAKGGEVRAMKRLAELYRIGRGVERDPVKAQEWRDKAVAAHKEPASE